MPPDKLFFTDWNRDRFLSWAEKTGLATRQVVETILDRAVIEQQAYRSCFGVLSLREKYGSQRLERASSLILSRTSSPTYQQLKSILEKKLDVPNQPKPNASEQRPSPRGFQQGQIISEVATLISDEQIMEQVEYIQEHLKIGADRDTLTNHFKNFLRESIFNESGDAPYKDGESYAFTTLDDPYKLEINETIRGRESDATIIDIFHDGDYLIKYEHNEKEAILQPETLRVMLDRLIPNFIETRKIGVIAHVFFDQNDLVTFAYLTFVHVSENNVYRIGYMPDGTVTFTINEFDS